jgi:antitoxin component of RelBE/YafQ-DinJ toxin-antitoxin module
VPNQPKTPQRTVRVPDDVWLAAQERAAQEGVTISEVIRRALQKYGAGQQKPKRD